MAPKPKPARFVFAVGMVLAMALTILTITADRDLAAPSTSPIYHPQLSLWVDQLFAADPGRPSPFPTRKGLMILVTAVP